ncbi:hypothetical protein P8C59_006565 [Phyllachora maydis]|uniref:Trimethyllysine dioxygenase n=1 Tax=Phyllachora maydis TaxID=1825666 RepID=A0AAD9MCN4_9PEZI|nr:hypothetical protein P8C59_006565 [Phyllachora maydis]
MGKPKRDTLPLFWLRDNCRCRECVNQDTGQRNFNTFAIPPDIAPTEVRSNGEEVLITWSDGHDSRYHWKFLEFYMSADHREEEKYRRIYLFGSEAAQKQPSISYDRVMAADRWASENAVALMTARLKKYGFTFVTDTPFDDPDKTKKLLERIAFIRLTHYGGFYDFIPDLAMADTAYTNQALSAHTDNTYFTDPAGLQAFHLLSHQAAPGPSTEATAGAGVGAGAGSDTNAQDAPAAGSQGGASLLVDGFHAAKVLQREDPRAFAVLTQVRLPWHASGNRGIAIAPDRRYPVLELDADADADGTGTLPLHRVRWNNDDRGVVPFHPDISPAEWYDAARKWDAILRRKDMEVWFQLEPGKVLIFDNWRVLHGRSAFTGIRRICGAYINRDDFISSASWLSPDPTRATAVADFCEPKTINYITHSLPQQCFRTAWTSPTPSAAAQPVDAAGGGPATEREPSKDDWPAGEGEGEGEGQPQDKTAAAAEKEKAKKVEEKEEEKKAEKKAEKEEREGADDNGELATSSFMSFEEWKEMMLRKSGDPNEIKARKEKEQQQQHRQERDPGLGNGGIDLIGFEGDIDLDFDALPEKVSDLTGSSSAGEREKRADGPEDELREEQIYYDDGLSQYYRSKDAGRTCKERFSYASFDAGATVLKTSPRAQNAKALLVENKDSYMLLECHQKTKFVIVELSDDILVDTIVLANFEFFSSMIRHFTVSVSDRYPVKADKWVPLGTFEARNSRDIQPFLVEHPQIYTKYVKIDFLSHYGNEYYCPVSLVRVHGTRMLDFWKEPEDETLEAPVTQDGVVEGAPASEPVVEQPLAAEPAREVEAEMGPRPSGSQPEPGLCPWSPLLIVDPSTATCTASSQTTTAAAAAAAAATAAAATTTTTTAAATTAAAD